MIFKNKIRRWFSARLQSRRATEIGRKLISNYANDIYYGDLQLTTRDLRNGLRLLRVKHGYAPFVQSHPNLAQFNEVAARYLEVWSLENQNKDWMLCPYFAWCVVYGSYNSKFLINNEKKFLTKLKALETRFLN
jgi:hypothetical protein